MVTELNRHITNESSANLKIHIQLGLSSNQHHVSQN